MQIDCFRIVALHVLSAARRTDAPEHDIVPGELKSVGISNGILQIRQIFHIHVENTAALDAPHVIMIVTPMVETVCSAGDLSPPYFAHFAQPLEVPIHSSPADRRVLLGNFLIYLVRGGVAL